MKDVEKKVTAGKDSNASVANATQKVSDSVKTASTKIVDATKNFSDKDFGKFKGKHVLIAALVVVVLVVFCFVLSGGSKGLSYPVIFSDDDGNLLLMNEKAKSKDNAIKLASDGSVSSVRYANTTDRYVLFTKNGDLYLYDSKKKDETTKIVSDVVSSEYIFTEDDKYVVASDKENNLYSYNFKGDKQKLDSDSEWLKVSNTHVVYEKENTLYIRSLNAKKDDRQKITDDYQRSTIKLANDGKRVLYINEDGDLYVYNVSKKEKEKIASEVSSFRTNDNCTKLYYVNEDNDIYYYDGKKDTKVVKEISKLLDVEVDKQIILFAKEDDGKYTIYMQKGTKDSVKVEDDLKSASGYIYENGIYYASGDDLKYAPISGSKIGKVSTVLSDVEVDVEYANGLAVIADVDKKANGTLYFVRNGKAKKVDTDVYASYAALSLSEDGKKVYYMKDHGSKSGDLYVTSGGKGKKIDSDVYSFEVVKSDLLYYLKDYSSSGKGDLYRYTGKSVKIAEDVRSIASIPTQYESKK